ncbi:MAG: CinA family protein [Opitutaceae bacterium]
MNAADQARLKELMLRAPALTLAVAESVTCGGIQQRVGRISGASGFFLGGVTAYSAAQKARHLGVAAPAALTVNSVSLAIAGQMAAGACRMFGADVSLATTGYAEADEAWKVAEPFAFWAAAWRRSRASGGGPDIEVVAAGKIECAGYGRAQAQDRFAEEALAALVAILAEERA